MNIIHMNEGRKAAIGLTGSILTLGTISIDLDAVQGDIQRVLTVYVDAGGGLSFHGEAYAAVVIIPPRRYTDMEATDGEPAGPPTMLPCQAGAVTLQLWALPPNNLTTKE